MYTIYDIALSMEFLTSYDRRKLFNHFGNSEAHPHKRPHRRCAQYQQGGLSPAGMHSTLRCHGRTYLRDAPASGQGGRCTGNYPHRWLRKFFTQMVGSSGKVFGRGTQRLGVDIHLHRRQPRRGEGGQFPGCKEQPQLRGFRKGRIGNVCQGPQKQNEFL